MNKLQTSWTKWRPRLVAAGAACFAIAVIAVLIGVIVGPGETKGAEKPAGGQSAPEQDGGGDAEDAGSSTGAELAAAPKLDADGLVPMEVTTDPRVAAASAAQVLMSVDTTKVQWVDDFRQEALARVMRPSPDYVGAGEGLQVQAFGGDTYDGDDLIERAPQMLATEKYSPEGWWWLVGDTQSFGGYTSYGASVVSRAIEVYDQEEVEEFTGGAFWTQPSDAISVDIDPEASFGLYWVRVETTTKTSDGETTLRYPVALSVYCDPPAEGGVCGVAALMNRYPDAWKTSY